MSGFKVGDHVTWNSEAGHVSRTITKVHTRTHVRLAGYRVETGLDAF